MSISDDVRHQLVVLCRRPSARESKFTARAPTEWRPHSVRSPDQTIDGYFSPHAVWEFVADYLERGGDVEEITLLKPPGAKAYVMWIYTECDERPVYVKLQLLAGKIHGRSFHYSKRNLEAE